MTGPLHTHARVRCGRPRGIAIVLAAIASLAGAALMDAAPAGAAGATFSITPVGRAPYFIFSSPPGAVVHGAVRVVNVSSVPGQASLYAVDATTGQTSGAV